MDSQNNDLNGLFFDIYHQYIVIYYKCKNDVKLNLNIDFKISILYYYVR